MAASDLLSSALPPRSVTLVADTSSIISSKLLAFDNDKPVHVELLEI